MIGNRDADGVDVFVGDDVAEVGDGFAFGQFRFFVFFIVVVDELRGGFTTCLVAVANRFHDDLFLLDELRHQHCAPLDSVADERHADDFSRFFLCFFCHVMKSFISLTNDFCLSNDPQARLKTTECKLLLI